MLIKQAVGVETSLRHGKKAMPAGFLGHYPQLCGLLASLASTHSTRSLSLPLSICPGCSHTWILLQSFPHQTLQCPDLTQLPKAISDLRLNVPRAMMEAASRGRELNLCGVPEMFPKAEVPCHPLLMIFKEQLESAKKTPYENLSQGASVGELWKDETSGNISTSPLCAKPMSHHRFMQVLS